MMDKQEEFTAGILLCFTKKDQASKIPWSLWTEAKDTADSFFNWWLKSKNAN